MSAPGPFLPFAALHQFDRSRGRSGHYSDISNPALLTQTWLVTDALDSSKMTLMSLTARIQANVSQPDQALSC
jgi:hypothetical protein